ncbi:hypothetical protein EVAR_58485_1, partial [Eumeta japonica]
YRTIREPYRTILEAYEAFLVTLDDSKPERTAVLAKVDADFLKIFGLAVSIDQTGLRRLLCRKESERTLGSGLSSVSSANAGALIDINLNSINGQNQDGLLFIYRFDSLVDLRTDLTSGPKFAYLLCRLSAKPRGCGPSSSATGLRTTFSSVLTHIQPGGQGRWRALLDSIPDRHTPRAVVPVTGAVQGATLLRPL